MFNTLHNNLAAYHDNKFRAAASAGNLQVANMHRAKRDKHLAAIGTPTERPYSGSGMNQQGTRSGQDTGILGSHGRMGGHAGHGC